MRVIEVTEFGGPEVLRPGWRPDPVAGRGEVVVRIEFAAVNPSDLGTRSGATHKRVPGLPLPFVPGWDLAGTVAAVGPGVTGFRPGDRVLGIIPWVPVRGRTGAYAEAAAVEAGWLALAPDGLDAKAAAALPLGGLTAATALRIIGAKPGTTLLVTGASGSVGSAAVQLAVNAGVRVLALASGGDEEWVASLGAQVLPRGTDLGAIEPVDYVFDAVPLGPGAAARLRDGGTAVFTRPPGEPAPDGVRFETVFAEASGAVLAGLAADAAAGRLKIRIADVFPLDDAWRAHQIAERGGYRGKLLLAAAGA